MTLPPLESFGDRIMMCGTSNTGKSTLAAAIERKLGLPAVHLDQFRFLPNTDWQERPDDAFRALHDEAIAGERWVMEGNYSVLMPQRIQRATGIILLSDYRLANFARYLGRTLFQKERIGALEGTEDSLKWSMVHWVLVRAPRNMVRYRARLGATGLPFLDLRGMRELNRAYAAWRLTRTR
ncbi:DNA topology modulation protein [soil metagenome]